MAETTEDCSSADDTLAVFSNVDADLRSLAPCSPAVSTDPEVIFISPPTSPLTHPPNQGWNDEPVSPDSTSTLEASDNDASVEASSTASVQFFADDGNEDQHKLPHSYSFPTDCSLSRPNQLKHYAETPNSVHSRQHRNDFFCFQTDRNCSTTDKIPTSLLLKTRVQHMGNYLLGQSTERTDYSEYRFVYPMHHGSPRSGNCPSSLRTLNSLELLPFLNSTQSVLPFPLNPQINFCSLSVG